MIFSKTQSKIESKTQRNIFFVKHFDGMQSKIQRECFAHMLTKCKGNTKQHANGLLSLRGMFQQIQSKIQSKIQKRIFVVIEIF